MKKILLYIISFMFLWPLQAQDKPNIIWLMAEDISTDLACYGMQAVKTPHLDKMAKEGILFENCFVTNPICSPSRSSMMVGTHQLKINAHHHRSNRDVPLNSKYKPFTYWLRQQGYTCVLGHHGVMVKGRKVDVNFKHEKIGEWDGETKFGLFDKYDRFEKEDQPFFAQIQLNVTHRGDWWDNIREKSKHPVNPDSVVLPPYMADHPTVRLDWAKYLDQMEYMDSEVGMIFKELEEKGMAENTVVIFIGDNGRCNIRGKGYLHDPGLRIPFLISWPEGLKGGEVRNEVVSSTDITATILDIAGIEVPEYMTGKSILKKGTGRKEVYAARDLWDEVMEKSRGITTERWKYIRNDKTEVPFDAHQAYLEFYRPAVHVMRTLFKNGSLNAVQKFFFEALKPAEELYDLVNDPHEIKNLAKEPKYKSVLEQMRELTKNYDSKMQPCDNTFNPVHPKSVEILEWVKNDKPELYKQMLEGVEIGFQKLAKQYKKIQKNK